jgi:hypothetical protein
VSAYALYDVTGLGRVKIFAKNNNAGQQTINHFSWRATGI